MSKLGKAEYGSTGSFKNRELLSQLTSYRKVVTNSYTLLSGEEIAGRLNMKLLVSPKLDGEQWFLIYDDSWKLVTSSGKYIEGDIEILNDAMKANLDVNAIYGGELHVLGSERKRIADLAALIGSGAKADTSRLGFAIWDLVKNESISAVGTSYIERYEVINKVPQSVNLFCIPTSETNNSIEVQEIYSAKCEKEELEGLICRAEDGRTFKVKPTKELDAAILGYTEKRLSDGSIGIRSLLFGLQQEDGIWIPIATTGNVGDENQRKLLHQQLMSQKVESSYRLTSKSSGVLYQMVRPTLVVEIGCVDIQVEDVNGKPIKDPKIKFDDVWSVVGQTNSASIHNALLKQLRNDKTPGFEDTGWNQILRILPINESETVAKRGNSEIIRRQVWTKASAEKTDVRKLVIWKTNKDGDYPAYVVHWTDFSSTRKSPLDREVRLAPNEKMAFQIAENMIEENIKKGWNLVS